jgi:AAA+ ATPase superfamily predicted ATPase
MLVLNGSYIGMMEETVLGYQAPLYGRRTAQYLLEPLDFLDAQQFFPAYNAEDRLRAYAVYGGTPAYLQNIQPELSLETNILQGILTRGAALYDEVRFVLQQELREPRNYFAILQAIASGNTRQNEIKQTAGIENITPYLETLQQIHLVERIVPVTETQPHKSRKGMYRLKDNFLRFWFRFVLPNRSQLERGAKQEVFDSVIGPEMDIFTSVVFEQVCRQYFWRIGLKGGLPFQPRQIGSWWDVNREIDVVALGEKQIMLVECKWSQRPVGVDILTQLEDSARGVLKDENKQIPLFGLCSRSGFTAQLLDLTRKREDVVLYKWKDMVKNG